MASFQVAISFFIKCLFSTKHACFPIFSFKTRYFFFLMLKYSNNYYLFYKNMNSAK